MNNSIKLYVIILIILFSFSCKDEPDINVFTDLSESNISLDSAVSVMSGTHEAIIKITIVNTGSNLTVDESYTYNLEIEHLLGNKLKLVNTYIDLGQDIVSHEVEVSISKIVDDLIFLKVDPIWNALQPNDRTHQATGTGSYVYDNIAYDGVFDIGENAFDLKFLGTTPTTSRVYIISTIRIPET